MKIKVNNPYPCEMLINVNQNSGVLLQALAETLLIESTGYGKDKVWKTSEKHLSFEIVPDDFTAAPIDIVKRLTDEVTHHSQEWLKAYQAQTKAEADLKALQLKLEQKGIVLTD